jgi:tRNA nucleotidyltransferase (CCA-adding enzyme)
MVAVDAVLVIIAVDVVLLIGAAALFLPHGYASPTVGEARRLFGRYRNYFVIIGASLVLQLLFLAYFPRVTAPAGSGVTSVLARLEGGYMREVAFGLPEAVYIISTVTYFLIHPFIIFFAPLLYILTDDERAAKTALIGYPVALLLALPFFLAVPVSPPYRSLGLTSAASVVLPEVSDLYQTLIGRDDSLPSIHVAVAIILASAASKSVNRRFRFASYSYAAITVVSPILLGLHWFTDVAMSIVVGAFGAALSDRITSVERLALKRVGPSPEKKLHVRSSATELVEHVTAEAKALGLDVKIRLVGSVPKDTYLDMPGKSVDIDVFVLFHPSTPREALEKQGLELGHKVLPDGIEKYAEHPYVFGTFKEYNADIVPCYDVASAGEKLSAVDRTPFHTEYVKKNLEPEARGDVRLLKAMMRGTGIYGADAGVQGFSGYLAELLVLKYGSFRGVLAASSRWPKGVLITLDPVEDPPESGAPLTFIDPVDPGRNVASAVSERSLRIFQGASVAYLRRPALEFFFPRPVVPLTTWELRRLIADQRKNLLAVTFDRPEVLEDALAAQLRKCATSATDLLERHGFVVRCWDTSGMARTPLPGGRGDKTPVGMGAGVIFELETLELPPEETHIGPPADLLPHRERFLRKWDAHPDALSTVREERGRLVVVKKREYAKVIELVHAKLADLDLGKAINAKVKERYEVLTGDDVVNSLDRRFVTQFIDGKPPWER